MESTPVFVSVGATSSSRQEDFVRAVETRLRIEGFEPQTVGRNTFSSEAPLTTITRLLDGSAGCVVIAFERKFIISGKEKRGGRSEFGLTDVKLPTPWNHIEAAMAYGRGLPLLVIVEADLRSEGLLEAGYDWFVQKVELSPSALSTTEFNGILADWRAKVQARASRAAVASSSVKPSAELTVGELVKGLRPTQLWSVVAAGATAIAAAFALGVRLGG